MNVGGGRYARAGGCPQTIKVANTVEGSGCAADADDDASGRAVLSGAAFLRHRTDPTGLPVWRTLSSRARFRRRSSRFSRPCLKQTPRNHAGIAESGEGFRYGRRVVSGAAVCAFSAQDIICLGPVSTAITHRDGRSPDWLGRLAAFATWAEPATQSGASALAADGQAPASTPARPGKACGVPTAVFHQWDGLFPNSDFLWLATHIYSFSIPHPNRYWFNEWGKQQSTAKA